MANRTKDGIIDRIIKSEGGYANDKFDPGGETFAGLTRSSNKGWEGWATIDQLKKSQINGTVLNDLNKSAHNWYSSEWYDGKNVNKISSSIIATHAFSMIIATPGRAIQFLARAINSVYGDVLDPEKYNKMKIPDDLIAYLNKKDKLTELENAMVRFHKQFYIESSSKCKCRFMKGWLDRVVAEEAWARGDDNA